jgi:hypothetical protein
MLDENWARLSKFTNFRFMYNIFRLKTNSLGPRTTDTGSQSNKLLEKYFPEGQSLLARVLEYACNK